MSVPDNGDINLPADEPSADAGGDGARDNGRGENTALPPDDDPVGFRQPPRRHQFKPGQSGNPKGRPKGAPGLRKILKKELSSRMNVPAWRGTVKAKGGLISDLVRVVQKMPDSALSRRYDPLSF